ncbi:putative aminotransferase [Emiliania huxleyi CCMP1516]|uniref:Aminotransferase class I/classII large domain-containing protein n=2 Tax=Emiliania huxleyi TaxID=2903 RepID=A0A0D3L297_EMIH1|nr:putative aminotransferase [Emiliania huxleyi CCMP1516]EOD42132.1 putative aminotransferase [Emiliania huxleyi CCMP1516]|eukprot:XP_005794561.1 putative aminotransferase [Emiliania huxleyi CCMP1516]
MVIDLRKGHPHAAFPLNYCSDVLGTRHFCDSLAKYLGRAYGGPVSPSWLMTTGGVSHGLDLATAALSRPGDTVLCESPTYFLVHQIFADHGLRIESLPTDADGLDTCALEARCEDSGKPPPRLLYLVPSHGNPSGATLPEARRSRLVELARKHGFYVLADEVYQLLDWSLRLGWVEAPPALLRRIASRGYLSSGGGVAPFVSEVACELLEAEQDEARALCAALRAEPGLFRVETEPLGGFFCWVRLPEGVDATELLPVAERHGVLFLPGARCAPGAAEPFRHHVRLCFAFETEAAMGEGVRRLAAAVREVQRRAA